MTNTNDTQLELFSQAANFSKSKVAQDRFFLSHLWSYERAILIAIGFIITAAVAFSLGMERGKRQTVSGTIEGRLDTVGRPLVFPVTPKQHRAPNVVPAPLPKPVHAVTGQSEIVRAPKSNIPAQAVTIQIASYKKREYAQREAEKLKKKGLMPRIIIKGSFSVLYVTASANKDSAKSLLAELQKEYKGCFIRRI
jgi:hypothetical protein